MGQKQEEMNGCGFSDGKVGGFSVSPQGKGRRNKRKLADPSQQNVANISSSLTEFPRYELPLLKSQNYLSDHGSVGEASNQLKAEESESLGWDDPFACHLEELLSSNLLMLFRSAMKQIVDCGYKEDVVLKAISGSKLYCGGNVLVSKIVNDTLSVLKNGKEGTGSVDYVFEDLQQLVAYTLVEMISLVREVRPSLSIVEAMWRLLMCDLNVLQAFEAEGNGLVSSPGISSSKSSKSPGAESNTSNSSDPDNPKPPQSNIQSNRGELKFGNFPNLPNSKNLHPCGTTPGKEVFSVSNISGEGIKSASLTLVSDEKLVSCRKGRTKKEIAMLRQKSCVEKIRTYSKCSGYKATKFASVGSFLVEKRGKSPSELVAVQTRNSSSKVRTDIAVNASKLNSPLVVVDSKGYITALPPAAPTTPVPTASEKKSSSESEEKAPVPAKLAPDYYAGIPYDASLGIYVPRDKKDELILKLIPRVNDLRNELQVWTDWANQKVKQATVRLVKDQPELKALRKEREEAERHKKEKQLLEENTMKRLSEMEFALNNANNQFEKANNSVRRLQLVQSILKKEMEAAKIRATESAESCREAKQRGKKSLKNTQSWEGDKILLQEELKRQRDKATELQQEITKAKNRQKQLETAWRQEMAAKGKLTTQANTIKTERNELESLGKTEEDRIKAKAENDVKYYIDNIKKLEREISKLKLKSDCSKIAALKKGIDGSKTTKNGKGTVSEKKKKNVVVTTTTTKIKRERECVMCLSEEMSVLFLPCAHQVLCSNCNQIHEKQGMEDCPSCRSLIQTRIQARFASG